MKARTLSGLKAHNTRLANRLEQLKGDRDGLHAQLQNSMATLVQSAIGQTNLTSFNPIVQNNIYAPLTINWTMLTYMYKTHGVIQTAIDVPVLDALRGGLDIQSDELDGKDIKILTDFMEEAGDLDVIGEAATWARLYGGAAIVLNTAQDGTIPLNPKRIPKLEIYAVNRWELGCGTLIDPKAAPMGNPNAAPKVSEFYDFYGVKLHNSRVLTISGKAAPYIVRWQLQGWGMSEVERMVEDFNAYIKTKNVLYELLNEAKMDVFRFAGLRNNLATAAGTALVQKRVEMANKMKNFQNAMILDKDDEYDQKQLTFSGLAEVMKENRIGIASALRIPLTKLFGISAAGFSSGEDDIENYNAMVESEVRQKLRPLIRKVLKLRMVQLFGAEYDFEFMYKPLRVMSAKEDEEIKTSKHNRYLADYDRNLLTSEELGQIEKKENLVPIETAAAKGLLEDHPASTGAPGGQDETAGDEGGETQEEVEEKETKGDKNGK